jgi:hypothetical protein
MVLTYFLGRLVLMSRCTHAVKKKQRWDDDGIYPLLLWQAADGQGTLTLMICTYPSNDLCYQTNHIIGSYFLMSFLSDRDLNIQLDFEQLLKTRAIHGCVYHHLYYGVRRHKCQYLSCNATMQCATMQNAMLCHANAMHSHLTTEPQTRHLIQCTPQPETKRYKQPAPGSPRPKEKMKLKKTT